MKAELELLNKLIDIGLERNWHRIEAKWGRHGTSSLLAHSINVAAITSELMKIMGGFTESDIRVGIALAFLHDIQKERASSREIIESTGRLADKVFSDTDLQELKKIVERIPLTNEERDLIFSLITHGAIQGIDHITILLTRERASDRPRVRRLVHEVADQLASIKSLDELQNLNEYSFMYKKLESFGLSLKYHRVSLIRGILTNLLHKTIHGIYEEAGFHPILFFPDGTVYIGKISQSEPDLLHDFHEKYMSNLKSLLDEISNFPKLGELAIGEINQTAIKSPRFAYLSDKTIEEFWDALRIKRVISDPNIPGISEADEEVLGIRELDAEIKRDWLKERIAIYHLSIYLKGILGDATADWSDNEAVGIVEQCIAEELNGKLDPKWFVDIIRGVSHTKTPLSRLETATRLRDLFPSDWDRKKVINECIELFKSISKRIRYLADKHKGISSLPIPELIRQELIHPLVGSPDELSKETWSEYTQGKKRGTPICILCGRKASKDAVAGLLGESQIFTNFLPGGTRIQPGNKLRICDLCDLEMDIRTLYTNRDAEFVEYYLIPQLNLSPAIAERWALFASKLLNDSRLFGVNPLSEDAAWARVIEENGSVVFNKTNVFEEFNRKLIGELYKKDRDSVVETVANALNDYINEMFDGDYELFFESNGVEERTLDNYVESIKTGRRPIPEEIKDRIGEINQIDLSALLTMITPNYILIAYKPDNSEKDDIKASNYLRHLFRACILSRLFIASVIIKEVRYEPLSAPSIKGAVRIPTNIQFDKCIKQLGIRLDDGWIKLKDVDDLLNKISSIILIEKEIRRLSPKKSVRGELVSILMNNPGRTLEKIYLLSENRRRVDFVRVIELLDEIAQGGRT